MIGLILILQCLINLNNLFLSHRSAIDISVLVGVFVPVCPPVVALQIHYGEAGGDLSTLRAASD